MITTQQEQKEMFQCLCSEVELLADAKIRNNWSFCSPHLHPVHYFELTVISVILN